jgi:hypothetical protein
MKSHLADGTTLRAKSTVRVWDAMCLDKTRDARVARETPGVVIPTAKLLTAIGPAERAGIGAYVKQRGRLVRVVSVS